MAGEDERQRKDSAIHQPSAGDGTCAVAASRRKKNVWNAGVDTCGGTCVGACVFRVCSPPRGMSRREKESKRKREREGAEGGGKRESVSHEPWGANKRVVAVVRCGVGSGISSYSISTLPPTPGSDRRRPSVAPSPSPPSRSPSSRPCALRFPHSRE